MRRAHFAIPGDLDLPTGGYAYDRRVLAEMAAFGIELTHLPLSGGYPNPTVAELAATERALAALPADEVVLIDGLAYGAMPPELIAAVKAPIVALCHHPLGHEAGLTPERSAALVAMERRALALAGAVVVTSRVTGETLQREFSVPIERITVAEPGTDAAIRVLPRTTGPCRLLAVGSIVPRKGYDVLVAALARLPDGLEWRLTIAGADRDAGTVAALRDQIGASRLASRITLAGPVTTAELTELYAASDLFVMASHYEGYGMVLAEAMARGLPIVTTTGGAAAETVPDGAGLKVPPGDAATLAGAMARGIGEPRLRLALAEASWAAGQRLPRWSDTVRRIAGVLASTQQRHASNRRSSGT